MTSTITLHPAGHILGSAQVLLEHRGQRIVVTGDYKRLPDRTAQPFELVPSATCWSPKRPSARQCSSTPSRWTRSARLLRSVGSFPDRAACHRLLRARQGAADDRAAARRRLRRADLPAWRDDPAVRTLHRTRHPPRRAQADSIDASKPELAGQIVIAPPSAIKDRWSRRLPDPVLAVASGWMSVKQRARQSGVELPLVISDHADWNELQRNHRRNRGFGKVWVTHGARGCAGLSVPQERARGRAAQHPGLRGRRGGRASEAVRATDGTAGAHPLAQPQARGADRSIFAIRPTRIAAFAPRHPHRRAHLQERETSDPARCRPRRGRSASVRAQLRLCRRSGRDHRADLAASRSSR